MSKKRQITQDELRELLNGYHFKRVRLAELTGLSEATLNVCFEHKPGNTGKPRTFSIEAIERINDALPRLAEGIRDRLLTFRGDKEHPNIRGFVYDPSLVEPIKKIGDYFNLTAMLLEVLKWESKKKDAILISKSSKVYGNITEKHVSAINKHLLNIYGNLSVLELVAGSDSSSSATDGEGGEYIQPKPVRRRVKVSNDGPKPWADVRLPLAERTRLYKKACPNGVLLYSATGGYAAAEDDARLVSRIDPTVRLDTQTDSGYVVAYMTTRQLTAIMRRLLSDGKQVAFTGLYA